MQTYRHTQASWWLILLLGSIAALTLVILPSELGAEDPTGTVVARGVGILMLVLIVLFGSLTIEVDDEHVVGRFGLGLVRKTIPLDEIVAVRAVRNRWWHGWGVRYVLGSGWMFNVAGLDAVEVERRSGKRFRFGTDEPAALVSAIETRAARP